MGNCRFTVIIFVALMLPRLAAATPITVAFDTASNSEYADGWDDGENGGMGFGPWMLSFDGREKQLDPAYNNHSHFIDGADVGPMPAGGLVPRSFGMTTTRNLDRAVAERNFAAPLSVGKSFSMMLDGSAFEVGQFLGIGNKIQLLGADGIPRYELVTTDPSNTGVWTANGSPTGVPYDAPARFSFSPTSDDTFSATLTSDTGGIGHVAFQSSLMGTPGQPITGIRFENIGTGSSSDGATEMFFDDLRVVEYVPEPGLATSFALACLGLIGIFRRDR